MTSEGLILFFSWVRDWIICKVRLYPQHSAVTNLLVTENKKSTNYGRGKATIYISYLWKYDLQIYNFNRSLVYNIHRFGSKKVVYNLQYFGPNCLQSTSKFRAKSTIYIITSPPPGLLPCAEVLGCAGHSGWEEIWCCDGEWEGTCDVKLG